MRNSEKFVGTITPSSSDVKIQTDGACVIVGPDRVRITVAEKRFEVHIATQSVWESSSSQLRQQFERRSRGRVRAMIDREKEQAGKAA